MRMITDMDDDEKGKLFVGGLSWETTQENLQRFFQRYGEVIDCVVMKNNESGRSRGFGFVTFSDPLNVNIVLQNGPHNLDGRTIDPKPCNPRSIQKPKKGGGYPKVFLGGLPSNVTETDLRVFFGRYGKVMEVVIMYDQEKKKSRGFGFLSFEDEASVERVTSEHYINLNGKQVEIKKAEPRDGSNNMGGMGGGPNKIANDNSQWGPPQPVGMMGPNGQMNAPQMNMPMGAPNMMPGYQGWGTTAPQQQGYGYGGSNAPGSYQGWGAPPLQGPPPPPHQWNNYGQPQQTQYGSYGPNAQSNNPNNWNSWNMQQNAPGTGAPGTDVSRILKRKQESDDRFPPSSIRTLKVVKTSDMYPRGGQTGGGGGLPSTNTGVMGPSTGQANNANKPASDYSGGYGNNYGNYTNDQNTSYRPRSAYGNDNSNQYQPQQPVKPMLYDFN